MARKAFAARSRTGAGGQASCVCFYFDDVVRRGAPLSFDERL